MRAKTDTVAGKPSVRRKPAPRGPESPAWVLVGTYKDGQPEAWPGFYNYPLKDGEGTEAQCWAFPFLQTHVHSATFANRSTRTTEVRE